MSSGVHTLKLNKEKGQPRMASLWSKLKSKKNQYSDKNIKKKQEINVSVLELFRFSSKLDKFLIILGMISALGASAVYPLMFLYFGQIASTLVDYIKSKSPPAAPSNTTDPNPCFQQLTDSNKNFDERVQTVVNLYVLFGFIEFICMYIANVTLNTTAEWQMKRIRNAAFKSIIRQDMAFFDKRTSGELNTIVTGNVESIKTSIGFKLTDFVSLIGRTIACVILALVVAPKFSAVFLAILPFSTILINSMISIIKKYTIQEFVSYGKAGQIAQETLSSVRTVLSLGLHRLFIGKYSESLKDAEQISIKKGLYSGLCSGAAGAVINLAFAIGIYYGVFLVKTDCVNYNPGQILTAFFCMLTGSVSMGNALPFLRDVSAARGAAAKVYALIDTKSNIDVFTSKGKEIKNLSGSIEFKDVHFSYPQRMEAKILKGLSLKIPAGKTVALVGSSGGGKSTVISLLQRFYLPISGKIEIDGISIDELDLRWLRSQTALVAQEPNLFTNTIRENIRLGRLDATDQEIEEAAKMANAHNFIMQTTKKYDTQVGERGVQLSGGQKQRIAIARALIRNPKILLLDEATSALDYESEKVVQDALDRAKIGRTTIIIAHRLSTIRNADLILALSNGQLVEMGNHDELMNAKGLYYDLVLSQTQQNDSIEDDDEKSREADAVIQEFSSDSESSSSESGIEDDIAKKKAQELGNSGDLKKMSIISMKSQSSGTKKKKSIKKKFRGPFYYERNLLKLQRPEALWIIVGLISQSISGAVFPSMSLVFSEIFRIFTNPDPNEQTKQSLQYMGILLGLGVINFIVTVLTNYSMAFTGAKLTKRIRIEMFIAFLRQEIGFHDLEENRSSILSTQLASMVPYCKGITVDKVGLWFQGIASVGFALIVSFILNWRLALFMIIFIPIIFFSGVLTARTSTNTKVANGKFGIEEAGRITIEVIENIKTMISLGREDFFLEEFRQVFEYKFNKVLAMLHLQAFFYSMSNGVLFFVQASAFSFGYYLIKNDLLELTSLYIIYGTILFSSMTLGRVYAQLPDQRKGKDASKIAFKILKRKSKIDSMNESGLRPQGDIKGEIEFSNVFFHYPNRPNIKILKGFNLSVKNGQTNALVGHSGCGKSTTISLLLRFYDIESGSIKIDGIDIRELNIEWLRSKIGLVSQEPILFNTSIIENIRYGDLTRSNISLNEIVEASLQSNIHNKIESIPDKYETIVGSKGGQMSGGEKQRIAIARALIRQPKILLLDEATSALDNQSEQIVQDALDKAQIGRTCIVIAHRLSTIEGAHKITVVKEGRVIEEGSHKDLLLNKGFYFKLQSSRKS